MRISSLLAQPPCFASPLSWAQQQKLKFEKYKKFLIKQNNELLMFASINLFFAKKMSKLVSVNGVTYSNVYEKYAAEMNEAKERFQIVKNEFLNAQNDYELAKAELSFAQVQNAVLSSELEYYKHTWSDYGVKEATGVIFQKSVQNAFVHLEELKVKALENVTTLEEVKTVLSEFNNYKIAYLEYCKDKRIRKFDETGLVVEKISDERIYAIEKCQQKNNKRFEGIGFENNNLNLPKLNDFFEKFKPPQKYIFL